MLQPYIKSYQVFQCPSNTRNTVDAEFGLGLGLGLGLGKVSYMAPIDFDSSNGAVGAGNLVGPNPSSFNTVSQTIAITEVNAQGADFGLPRTFWDGATSPQTGSPAIPALFVGHLSTANQLFVDGHVKSMKPLQTVSTAMGGSGTINMWDRTGADYTGGTLTSTMSKLTAATNFYK